MIDSGTDAAVVTRSLEKRYGPLAAVAGLDFEVPRGAVYGFLGRNGAGKTTTLKMLTGLLRPTAGRAFVLGFDVARQPVEVLRRTAFVGENKILYEELTPAEMVRWIRTFYPAWSDEIADTCARRLEIPMRQRIGNLSKGNRAKVWLLLALAQGAELLVADEPASGLDPCMNDTLLRLLAELFAGQSRTVLFSTHHLEEVEQICDWVGIVDGGRMLLEAPLEDLRDQYRLVIAAGRDLPATCTAPVVMTSNHGKFSRYLLARDAESFAAGLRAQGAAVTEVASLSLREVFLELVRKEESHVSVEMLAY